MKLLKVPILALAILAISSCQPNQKQAKPPVRLGPEVEKLAAEMLGSLEAPVTIRITRGGEGEEKGEEAQALVDLLPGISPGITLENLSISERMDAESLGVPRGPVIEIMGKAPGILRYYGYPERKETKPFFEGILSASGKPADLPPGVRSFFSELNEPVWIRIFTTPD